VTVPRQVVAGRSYLISRRCTQRQLLLRPDAHVEQIFLYCLGEAADRYGITLHAWIAMSNHEHLLLRDNHGNYPAFLAHFHKMVAKSLNAYWKRWENFWAAEQPSAVYLVEAQDRFDKLIYLLANPVAAHLVERANDWPGATSLHQQLSGSPRKVTRPVGFFSEDGPMPESVTLRVQRPDGFEHLSDNEWNEKVLAAVRAAEDAAREHRKQNKLTVLGRKAVLKARPTDRPRSAEPRRELRPLIACGDFVRRVAELGALRRFRAAYRTALERYRAGKHKVRFPAGTYRVMFLGAWRDVAFDLGEAATSVVS
jgi:putative transposase